MGKQLKGMEEEKPVKLTEREKKFCKQYLLVGSGAKAAREAGYSKDSAAEIAYENLRKPHIKAEIARLKCNIEETTGVTLERVAAEYAKIAFASITDTHADFETLKDFSTIPKSKLAAIGEVNIDHTTNEFGKTVKIKIKMHPKTTALDGLARLMGYNAAAKVENTIKSDGAVVIYLPDNARNKAD